MSNYHKMIPFNQVEACYTDLKSRKIDSSAVLIGDAMNLWSKLCNTYNYVIWRTSWIVIIKILCVVIDFESISLYLYVSYVFSQISDFPFRFVSFFKSSYLKYVALLLYLLFLCWLMNLTVAIDDFLRG